MTTKITEINWLAFQTINSLSSDGLMRGETRQLTETEILHINLKLEVAQRLMKEVEASFNLARERFAKAR